MIPPHMPPPSVSIALHHLWRRLRLIFVVVIVGAVAGFSGAAMLFGWTSFNFINGGSFQSTVDSTSRRAALSEAARLELRRQIITVYRAPISYGDIKYFSSRDIIGRAVVISSEGWAVLYFPTFDGNFNSWKMAGSDNNLYSVERAVFDKQTGLVYFKIAATETANQAATTQLWRAAAFADKAAPFEVLFAATQNGWQSTAVQSLAVKAELLPHLDSAPMARVVIDSALPPGSVVVKPDGLILGVVTSGNMVMPLSSVAGFLPSLFTNGKIIYSTFGAEGWFSEEQPLFVKGAFVNGFFVSKIVTTKSVLARGDIIEEINGQAPSAELFRQIQTGSTARLRVRRAGKIIELTAPVLQL